MLIPTGPDVDYRIVLKAEGSIDLTGRNTLIEEFEGKFSDKIKVVENLQDKEYRFFISLLGWESAKRHLQTFVSFTQSEHQTRNTSGGETYSLNYRFNRDAEEYQIVNAQQ